MNDTQFPGDDGTLGYARDSGVYVPEIECVVPSGRARFSRADVLREGPATFLCFGQSNAGNSGHGAYVPRHAVYCFNPFDSQFYAAEDPLPGATGTGASAWGRLGELLVESGLCKSVLFVCIAVGGSYLAEWAAGGPHGRRLALAVERAGRAGIAFEHLLWCQGEAEANLTDMSRAVYMQHFRRMLADLRRMGVAAPIYVARSTLCATAVHPYDNREEIRAAQAGLPDRRAGVLPGPDIDTIGMDGRTDGCHFNEIGLRSAARLWFDCIAPELRPSIRRKLRQRLAAVFGTSRNS